MKICIYILLILAIAVGVSGCFEFEGISIGATYLNTNIEFMGQQNEIKEVMPIVMVNLKSKQAKDF